MLTEADRAILPLIAAGKVDEAAKYYLNGFVPLPWHYAYYYVPPYIKDVTVLGGIACGKTRMNTAKSLLKSISIPHYRTLNTSVTAGQSELPFDMAMSWIEGNPRLERHISNIRKKPWPMISFNIGSVYEFRTAGVGARFIRGSEYDEIDYDEGGLDITGDAVKVLRGRLRGVRDNGIPRLARLNVVTSPTDAIWLRERYEKGVPTDSKFVREYLSFKIRTRDNIYLTEEQIQAMEAEYSDEMRAVEMDAEFPDYGLSMFPSSHVHACTRQELLDVLYDAQEKLKAGYSIQEHPRHGITFMEFPRKPGAIYVVAGDPGTDDPPRRNAGCVIVCDVSTIPAKMVYFDWVTGMGSYMPWLNSMKRAIATYNPAYKLIDATGPQKMMQEIAFENVGIDVAGISFSTDKDGMLNALSLAVTQHQIVWPPIKGLIRQMSTYTRELEKDKKFPQDIVMTLAMLSYAAINGQKIEDNPVHVQKYNKPSRRHRAGAGGGRRHYARR